MNPQPDLPAACVDTDEGTPVSLKIRERIQAANKRFNANDNIADFIQPGELDQLLDEVTRKMEGVLDSLVIDTASDHNTRDTARRVAKMYVREVFKGRYVKAPPITEFPKCWAPERTDDCGPDHGTQCLQPSFLSHHGENLDWRVAQ